METWSVSVGFTDGSIKVVTLHQLRERNRGGFPVFLEPGVDHSSAALRALLQEPLRLRLRELFSIDGFLPAHAVLSGQPVFVATSLNPPKNRRKSSEPLVPIMWRIEKPAYENLWHFVHEVAEIELKLSGVREPRWLVEGISQYSAYVYFKRNHPHWLEHVWRHYHVDERVDIDRFLNWGYEGLTIKGRTTNASLKDVLAWAVGQHATADERRLYGTALEIFVDSFSGREEPRRLFEIARSGPDGISWIKENLKRKGI